MRIAIWYFFANINGFFITSQTDFRSILYIRNLVKIRDRTSSEGLLPTTAVLSKPTKVRLRVFDNWNLFHVSNCKLICLQEIYAYVAVI